jgi:hypothetical protein
MAVDQDGEQVAWISLQAEADLLRLQYRVCVAGGDWQEVEETVRTPCQLGGSRPYFVCPGVVNGVACGHRVAKLFGAGRYFLCRHCHGLAYASQGEGALDRTLRRANKVRQRLGGEPGMAAHFPGRPKGMWQRTYDRLSWTVLEAEMAAEDQIHARLARVATRLVRPRPRRRPWR